MTQFISPEIHRVHLQPGPLDFAEDDFLDAWEVGIGLHAVQKLELAQVKLHFLGCESKIDGCQNMRL